MTGSVGLAPLLPDWGLGLAAALLLLVVLLTWRWSRRTTAARALAAALLLLLLANPVWREERREARPDIALVLVDRSASMALDGRGAAANAAVTRLKAAAPDVRVRRIDVGGTPGRGTELLPALDRALQTVAADRLAAAVLVTDGAVEDRPGADASELLPAGRPLHLLIAGDPQAPDRRLSILRAPGYSIVGQPATVTLMVDDGPRPPVDVRLDWQLNGVSQPPRTVRSGEKVKLRIPVARRGLLELSLAVEPMAGGELTLANNRSLLRLNGVQDRLNVLLVSGVPYPGGRVWRDLLKADSNIDLIHFTILRLPSSYDPTPSDELALIPFPVDELFQRRLPGFDLVIFDRFELTDLLSPAYFDALVRYARAGGGLLFVGADDLGAPGGLASTSVAAVLPARVTGPPEHARFVPRLTPLGRRHPVTATLERSWGSTDWGAWQGQAEVTPLAGARTLMTGAGGRPLLVVGSARAGRVGLLASTSLWWWAREVAGGGPREELLRRLIHWLMQEPDLEEQQLEVTADEHRLEIEASGTETPREATITGPDQQRRIVPLEPLGEGRARARAVVRGDGIYRVRVDGRERRVLAGEAAELADVRPRARPLEALAAASGGGVFWLKDGQPAIRRVLPGGRTAGPGWLGLVRGDGGRLLAVEERPLVPPPVSLTLLTVALAWAWWRERR